MTNPMIQQASRVPPELLEYRNWVAWRLDPPHIPGEKPRKVPINPGTGNLASTTDSRTWGSFNETYTQAETDSLAGVGFVFTGTPFCGVDLDHCVNGTLEPWAQDIVHILNSYTEVSPSGTGVHILLRGKLPDGRRKHGNIEMYDQGRYFTFTGHHVDHTPFEIVERTTELAELHRQVFGETQKAPEYPAIHRPPIATDDSEIVSRMLASASGPKIQALMDGDSSAHGGDDSAADMALCAHLAFWTGKDAARMDRIFRQSKLMRPKWDERRGAQTYGQKTIATAVAGTPETWTPGAEKRPHTVVQATGPYSMAEAWGETVATFQRYLYMPDPSPLAFDLGVVIANFFEGSDPVWGLKIGSPGSGKTETLNGLVGLDNVYAVATLTVGGLLSGTSKRERKASASGGLLREIGEFGIIALKDFGSIMSMARDARAELLAALREIFDGSWGRCLGTDGGKRLEWHGKVGVIGCATPAIDAAHGVMGTLGERFVLYRMPEMGDTERAQTALSRCGDAAAMRTCLSNAVKKLIGHLNPPVRLEALTAVEQRKLIALASLAAKCRSAVMRDSYRREIELVPAAEVPTRMVLVLSKLYQAFQVIGMSRVDAWRLTCSVAMDSMPQVRRVAFDLLISQSGSVDTSAIAVQAGYPTVTIRRALEDLGCHGIVERESRGTGNADAWRVSEWAEGLFTEAHTFSEM